jgi:hypothetical protein
VAMVNLKIVTNNVDPKSEPLNVVVEGEDVVIVDTNGDRRVMTLRAAQMSATRLLDAITIAQGGMPSNKSATGLVENALPPKL